MAKKDDYREGAGKKVSRRAFVKYSSVGMLTIGLLGCGDEVDGVFVEPQETTPDVTPGTEFFPQGVASGDPRSDSVVFWTRIEDPELGNGDAQARLVIAMDEGMSQEVAEAELTAYHAYDCVLKFKAVMLDPYTTYYYRFDYLKNGSYRSSRIGRTKTAASRGMDVPVKFGFVSCQDYKGRYFNTYARMLEEDDLDFFLHLGDYIYETSSKDGQDGVRAITFEDQAGAIQLPDGSLAAASLDNYRQLYKTYRSDEMLQRMHERFPMIAIWDDHEFSDDSWRNNANYFGGRADESSSQRKRNAEQAFAEFMPVAFGLNGRGELAVADSILYPNTAIYRDFRFGQHLHLMMTDYRTFRPDHLVAEDAWPGTVLLDEPTIRQMLALQGQDFDALAANFDPYFNVDEEAFAVYKQVLTGVLTQQYMAGGLDAAAAQTKALEKVSGNISSTVANLMIVAYNSSNPPQPLPPIDPSGMPRGFSVIMFGKQTPFGDLGFGVRYIVVKDSYDFYAAVRYFQSGKASEDVFGAVQQGWLLRTLEQTDASWKVLGNSTSMTSMVLDLSAFDFLPPEFRRAFYLNVDQWDGFPNKRAELMQFIENNNISNTVLLAGDIHTTFVADHGNGVAEFTTNAISSATFKAFLREGIVAIPQLGSNPGAIQLVEQLGAVLQAGSPVIDAQTGKRQMQFVSDGTNGFGIVEVSASEMVTTMYLLGESEVTNNLYNSSDLDGRFETARFRVMNGGVDQI